MGCCFSKSTDDDDKGEVIRVRTQSRIPPMKKTDKYGTLSDDESDSLEKSQVKENQKEKESQDSESKPPYTPRKFFGKLPGGRSPNSPKNEPQNPFQTSKKSKLKRNYATREKKREKKNPATKYAQNSPVLNRIKTGHSYGTLYNDEEDTHEMNQDEKSEIETSANPPPVSSLQNAYRKGGNEQSKSSKKYGQSSPVLQRIQIAQTNDLSSNLNESNSNASDNIWDKPMKHNLDKPTSEIDARTTDSTNEVAVTESESFTSPGTSPTYSTFQNQPDVIRHASSSVENTMSLSQDSGNNIGLDEKQENLKLSETKTEKAKKKNTPKKIASKLGKYMPGKKKKNQKKK